MKAVTTIGTGWWPAASTWRAFALFGDEQQDYSAALQRHYQQGAPADWQSRFISAYASSHPWEDWAESWAHYLHMIDVTDDRRGVRLDAASPNIRPTRRSKPTPN